ncbi:hypothetical protein JQ629_02490 [Bradyrhizobium sp. AUGA SZCCT0222]|uniref:hypothetical protein n=1 Tax=Bradyrhizobium sp. AUGA SZCCT0222 TaxID=2807668 RepID=UPI001BA562C6|nr:hypothetical protein [Bradyrhizobium sp. AUGA SZCCT0222]MBR1266368.1 hypothetical protein [Bradyrhizobium sp. AUGA SZCCT0222]
MSRAPPELNLKIGPFSVSAKGAVAVRAIRWPVAFAVTLTVPIAVGLAIYALSHIGMLRSIFWQWWPL